MKADLTAETVERKNDIGKILAKLDRIAEVSETFRKQIAIMLIGWALTSLVMIGIAVRTQL